VVSPTLTTLTWSGAKPARRIWHSPGKFAEAVHAKFPGKLLAYNCSPSFNWKKNLDDATIAKFQRELGAMGYKYQFITLAGIHNMWYNMFDLAQDYVARGMSAYVEKVQEPEFAARDRGYTFVSHQQEVGTGYFDDVTTVIQGGKSRGDRADWFDRRRTVPLKDSHRGCGKVAQYLDQRPGSQIFPNFPIRTPGQPKTTQRPIPQDSPVVAFHQMGDAQHDRLAVCHETPSARLCAVRSQPEASMLQKVVWMTRSPVARQVVRTGYDHTAGFTQLDTDHAGIGQAADAHGAIHILVDEVDHPVCQIE
jgi:hypothetical protein